VRVVIALAFIVGVGLSWRAGVGAAVVADDKLPPISQCFTVTVSPPLDMRPSVTVCQP